MTDFTEKAEVVRDGLAFLKFSHSELGCAVCSGDMPGDCVQLSALAALDAMTTEYRRVAEARRVMRGREIEANRRRNEAETEAASLRAELDQVKAAAQRETLRLEQVTRDLMADLEQAKQERDRLAEALREVEEWGCYCHHPERGHGVKCAAAIAHRALAPEPREDRP